MKIKLIRLSNYLPSEIKRLNQILFNLDTAINSPKFNDLVLNHIPFDTIENYSNKNILKKILEGDEKFTNEGIDFEADLDLSIDSRHSTDAIGYTTSNGQIFTFRNIFQNLDSFDLAGHFAHEYCHTLGFIDPQDLRDTSKNVPYEIGRIITELARARQITFVVSNQPELENINTPIFNESTDFEILTQVDFMEIKENIKAFKRKNEEEKPKKKKKKKKK